VPKDDLTPAQRRFVTTLWTSKAIEDAAETTGVSKRTGSAVGEVDLSAPNAVGLLSNRFRISKFVRIGRRELIREFFA
jgi:hypothetical protein